MRRNPFLTSRVLTEGRAVAWHVAPGDALLPEDKVLDFVPPSGDALWHAPPIAVLPPSLVQR